jgi:SAM-dependent methyltransferase
MIVRAVRTLSSRAVRLSMKGLPRGPHISRFFMYRHLAQFRQSPNMNTKVLSISHSHPLCEVLGLDRRLVTEANYPAISMLSLPFLDSSFDYVVSDQILEHVEGDPQRAIDETLRVLKPGGLAIHATCFINPIHGAPGDFWRFTPAGLRLLCRGFSRVIECGGWGNPYAWAVVWLGLRYDGVPEAGWHPLHKLATHNNPDWPIVTWIIAQK